MRAVITSSPPSATCRSPERRREYKGDVEEKQERRNPHERDNITIGTKNTRALRTVGKLQEVIHEMDRY